MDSKGLYALTKTAQHSKNAMSQLVFQFDPLVKKLARRTEEKLQDRGDAEQELRIAIIKAVQSCHLENFPKDGDISVLSYIVKSIRHRYIQLIMKKQSTPQIASSELDDFQLLDPAPQNQWLAAEMLELLDKLAPQQKQIIIGYYYYGCSDQDMADKLHISRQAVYKNRIKALGFLRKQLG